MVKPTLHWRAEWKNGTPTFVVAFSDASAAQRREIERAADGEGFARDGDRWSPAEGAKLHRLFEVARTMGFNISFEREDEDAPFDLQRLQLSPQTRERLSSLVNFRLNELAGYCHVQAQGEFDGQYLYF